MAQPGGGLLGLLLRAGRGLGDRQRGPEQASRGAKVLWIVLLLVLPVIGFVIWLIAGRALDRAGGRSYTAPRLRTCGVRGFARARQ